MEKYSYIIKVKYNDKHYICNRNWTWFNNLIKPSKIVNFWGIESESVFQIGKDHQIIAELKCSNTRLKDQKYINEIKREIIAEDPELSINDHICDIVISSNIQKYKSKMREYKKRILAPLDKCTPNEIESFIDVIKGDNYMSSFLNKPRYHFPQLSDLKIRLGNSLQNHIIDKLYSFWIVFYGAGIGDHKDQGIQGIWKELNNIVQLIEYKKLKLERERKKKEREERKRERERKEREERLERERLERERLEKLKPRYIQLTINFDNPY